MATSLTQNFSKEEFKKNVISNCKSLYRKNIEEAIAYSQKREHSSKIKELMQKIKDVAAGIPGGIIANGICQLIQSIFS